MLLDLLTNIDSRDENSYLLSLILGHNDALQKFDSQANYMYI